MAAPAPMNLATVPMSLEMALVQLQLGISEVRGHRAAKLRRLSSVSVSSGFSTTVDIDPAQQLRGAPPSKGVERNFAQTYIFRG